MTKVTFVFQDKFVKYGCDVIDGTSQYALILNYMAKQIKRYSEGKIPNFLSSKKGTIERHQHYKLNSVVASFSLRMKLLLSSSLRNTPQSFLSYQLTNNE